jgi:hypothetical protein
VIGLDLADLVALGAEAVEVDPTKLAELLDTPEGRSRARRGRASRNPT